MSLRARVLQAMNCEDTSPSSVLLRGAMTAAVPFYAAGNALRSAGFSAGIKQTKSLGRPTLSVGNLTTGGTGKTPMVGYLVRQLVELGHKPCILLRGYRGGDEAEEHKLLLGDLAYVEPNPDRVAAAQIALGEHPDITCFVLDDGFQHRRAQRDLNLVLIDASNPWGFDHLLPRGLMREPKAALKRADALIITHAEQADEETLEALNQELEQITGKPAIAQAEHIWTGLRDDEDNTLPLETIKDYCVMGVVGIGNPDAFTETLMQHADRVVHCEALPDHHHYSKKQVLGLIDLAIAARAQAMITTEKDWVKWSILLEDEKIAMPIYRAALTMRWKTGEQALNELVGERMKTKAPS